ncbi:PEP-CTERM sorting domain-containing protein [Thiohalobacter sp. IOR34]|uniref:PEP-CTERM sorting domain-containing protein n=1 Tax=Thiohalobacter sp. IOR34 TaxID=3057176 RepID=UPI0025B1104A|nr:PEP-CTERM sorting domain-containing protein [Thiohalobacter sp. IOR34]WJW76442.1 PEP-CTERM sorting domain-containing protein [Thiohalobacter sp. IOR34]
MLIVGCLAASLLVTTQVSAIPITRLEPSATTVSTGSAFSVDVYADGITDVHFLWGPDELLAFGFDILMPPTGINFTGATVGSAFHDDSSALSLTQVAGSAFPGVSGDNILLARLDFEASLSGIFTLGITSDPSDPNEGLITFLSPFPTGIETYMTVNVEGAGSTGTVPEPSTPLLMALGGLGLVRHRLPRTARGQRNTQ